MIGAALVMRAAEFATIRHDGQRRGSRGVPYVHHCFDVARRLADAGVTAPEALAIAILHDTVEDTNTAIEEIHGFFGREIAVGVEQLTLPKDIGKDYERKVAYQCRMMEIMGDWARAVKVADKASNVADLVNDPPSWGRRAMLGYANDAKKVVDVARERWFDPARPGISSESFRRLVLSFDEAHKAVIDQYTSTTAIKPR